MLQAAPTIQQDEHGENRNPRGLHPDGESEESCNAHKADDGGNHQAASAA